MKRFGKNIPAYRRKDVPLTIFILSFLLMAILTVVVK